jgi:Peptidase M50B-like
VTGTGIAAVLGGVLDGVLAAARDHPAVLVAGLLALLAVGWTTSWRLTRGVVTIAHEGGHALVAVLTGRGLGGIRLHADSSGATTSIGRDGGLGLVLTFLGGYPAPAALGLVAALLVASGRAAMSLWLVVVLLVVTLTQVRNAFGVVSVLATGAVVAAVAWGATRRCRQASPPRWRGSCCSAGCARCASCNGGAAGASRPGSAGSPMRTRSRGSPGCPVECGRRCSGWSARWPSSRAGGCW